MYVKQFRIRNLAPEIKSIDLDGFLRSMDSTLIGLGGFIKDCAELYKINEVFILALIGLESWWGKSAIAKIKNNLCGWGAIDSDPGEGAWRFHSKEGCIMTVCAFLDRNYLTQGGKYYKGGTIGDVGKVYASDKEWADKIVRIMNQFERFMNKK